MVSEIVVSKKGVSQICHWENNIVNRRVANGSRSETGGQIEFVFRKISIAGAEIVHWRLVLDWAVSMALVLVTTILCNFKMFFYENLRSIPVSALNLSALSCCVSQIPELTYNHEITRLSNLGSGKSQRTLRSSPLRGRNRSWFRKRLARSQNRCSGGHPRAFRIFNGKKFWVRPTWL